MPLIILKFSVYLFFFFCNFQYHGWSTVCVLYDITFSAIVGLFCVLKFQPNMKNWIFLHSTVAAKTIDFSTFYKTIPRSKPKDMKIGIYAS